MCALAGANKLVISTKSVLLQNDHCRPDGVCVGGGVPDCGKDDLVHMI